MRKISLLLFVMLFGIAVNAQRYVDVEPGSGTLEAAINNDDAFESGTIYRLQNGGAYLMLSQILFEHPGETLKIICPEGAKAILLPHISGDVALENHIGDVYGSLTLDNLYIVGKRTDDAILDGIFFLRDDNSRVEVLNTVIDMLWRTAFDFSLAGNDITQHSTFIAKNTYFRDFAVDADGGMWAARAVEIRGETDTLWFENCTFTNAGLAVVAQGNVTKFTYINHCSFINSAKYPLLIDYKEEAYITNNLFINSNWMGEDKNIFMTAQDPDPGRYHGVITVDTLEAGQYLDANDLMPMEDTKIFFSDNIFYVQEDVLAPYYNGDYNTSGSFPGQPVSNLDWGQGKPNAVENIPSAWANERTLNLINDYDNIKAERNHDKDMDPQLVTPGFEAEDIDGLAAYARQNYGWGTDGTSYTNTWSFGDRNSLTVPGVEDEGSEGGMAKISDLIEDFTPQNPDAVSAIDGFKIGALHWIDSEITQWNSEQQLDNVKRAYNGDLSVKDLKHTNAFKLSNYPNPATGNVKISFVIASPSNTTLKVYNVLGKQVATLVNGNISIGTHEVEYNCSKLNKGVYFTVLTDGNSIQTSKLIIK